MSSSSTSERLLDADGEVEYTYEFGDSWVHQIVVEKIEQGDATPRCIGGERACPPEDSGGAWGFGELLAALSDEQHPGHDEKKEWVPSAWSPAHFDLERANRLVARHRPVPGRPRASKSRTSRARA